MDATAVAPVLAALHALFRAALPSTVEVTAGEPLNLNAAEVLSVGYSANRPSVEITQSVAGQADNYLDETLSVACLASSLRGEMTADSVTRVRNEAVALVHAAKTALASDPLLGGLAESAEVHVQAFDQRIARDDDNRGRGVVALVEFTVDVVVL